MTEKIAATEDFQSLVESLIGLVVSLPWHGYGSAIFFELGNLTPLESPFSRRRYHEEGEACIGVYWDWRVEREGSILYGSSNSGPRIERGIGTLRGAKIERVSLSGEIPELGVYFSTGHRLRSMAMVTGDPEWRIRLQNGSWLYSRDGDLLLGDGTDGYISTDAEKRIWDIAERTALRWGVPRANTAPGRCKECAWFVPIDGEAELLDYGVCIESASQFDGRIVNLESGCPCFTVGTESAAQTGKDPD